MKLTPDIPFAELDIPSIARYAKEQAELQEPEIRQMIIDCIPGLFDTERAKVHQTIRSISYLIQDAVLGKNGEASKRIEID